MAIPVPVATSQLPRLRKSLRIGGFELVDWVLYEFPPGDPDRHGVKINESPGSRIMYIQYVYSMYYIIYIYMYVYIYSMGNCKDHVGERMLLFKPTWLFLFSMIRVAESWRVGQFHSVSWLGRKMHQSWSQDLLTNTWILVNLLHHRWKVAPFAAGNASSQCLLWRHPEDTVRIWMDHFEENQLRVFRVFSHWATHGVNLPSKPLVDASGWELLTDLLVIQWISLIME